MDAEDVGGKAAGRGPDPLHDRDRPDAPDRVRAFGGVAMALAPVFWALVHFLWDSPRAALWIAGIVLVWGGLSFALPVAMGPVLRGWMAITRPIGLVVTSVLLAIVYFVVLTPLALLRRALGRNALALRTKRGSRETYWVKKELPPPGSPRWYRPF